MLSKRLANFTESTTKWLWGNLKVTHSSSDIFTSKETFQPEGILDLPLKSKPINDYQMEAKEEVFCFHEIFKVTKKEKLHFLKRNDEDSPMSELEATCRAFYDLIAPHRSPASATPVYNMFGKFIGVCLRAITGFKSVMSAPFIAQDFQIPAIDQQLLTIKMMDKLDHWARANHLDLELLVKAYAVEKHDKTDIQQTQKNIVRPSVDQDENSVNEIIDSFEIFKDSAETEKIKQLIDALDHWFTAEIMPADNIDQVSQLVKILAQDLIHFRYVKGFGIAITTSNILEEDDLHRGNIGRGIINPEEGAIDIVRIDFDMMLWDILFEHKASGPWDKFTRNPSSKSSFFRSPTGRFVVSEKDILSQPGHVEASPFYDPIKGVPGIPVFVQKILPHCWLEYFANNAFTPSDNEAFSTLNHNPVYNYYKFRTYLKFLLTDGDMYRNIATLYIGTERKHLNKNMIETLALHQTARIAKYREKLFNVKEFITFLECHGEEVKKDILNEFAERNKIVHKKLVKDKRYECLLVDLKKLDSKCDEIIYKDQVLEETFYHPEELERALGSQLTQRL